jgi:hypothetical protein
MIATRFVDTAPVGVDPPRSARSAPHRSELCKTLPVGRVVGPEDDAALP